MKGTVMPSEWLWKGVQPAWRVWELRPRKTIYQKKLKEVYY